MSKYKVHKDYEGLRSSVSNFGTVSWSDASQEILAHLYEDRKLTSIIIKTKSNEESNTKKSNKKGESAKKDS